MSIVGRTVFPWKRRRRASPVATTLDLSALATSMAPGETLQLTAVVLDAHGNTMSGAVVTWGSSNTAVATVNGSGLVTGVAAGSFTITATSGSATDTLDLEVDMLRSASVTLTNAQIRALPSTPIQVIAAPGAGLAILPLAAFLSLNSVAGAYTGVSSDPGLALGWNDFAARDALTGAVSGFLDVAQVAGETMIATHTTMGLSSPVPVVGVQGAMTGFANVNLVLAAYNDTDFGGGNAANTLKVTVLYCLVAV